MLLAARHPDDPISASCPRMMNQCLLQNIQILSAGADVPWALDTRPGGDSPSSLLQAIGKCLVETLGDVLAHRDRWIPRWPGSIHELRKWLDQTIVIGVEEERRRIPFPAARVNNAMHCRLPFIIGPALQGVAYVADEHPLLRKDIHPSAVTGLDLEPSDLVLPKDRHDTVIGMSPCSDGVTFRLTRLRRISQQPELG